MGYLLKHRTLWAIVKLQSVLQPYLRYVVYGHVNGCSCGLRLKLAGRMYLWPVLDALAKEVWM